VIEQTVRQISGEIAYPKSDSYLAIRIANSHAWQAGKAQASVPTLILE
jgi:hypothetical protein